MCAYVVRLRPNLAEFACADGKMLASVDEGRAPTIRLWAIAAQALRACTLLSSFLPSVRPFVSLSVSLPSSPSHPTALRWVAAQQQAASLAFFSVHQRDVVSLTFSADRSARATPDLRTRAHVDGVAAACWRRWARTRTGACSLSCGM